MHDGFGTIKDGYFVPHSHELQWCNCGRLRLLPVGATQRDETLAETKVPGTGLRSSGAGCCPCG
jgi:hypothetical protein